MAKTFSAMKKKKKSFDELAEKLEKTNSNSNYKKDERFFYPELDKAGNGFAIIRFLPAPSDEDLPWIKRFQHGFKDQGGWYIEECPTTIDKDCPLCKANGKLVSEHGGWDETPQLVKNVVSKRKRNVGFVSNIYVVQDSKHPENEGKVFLFRYGKKIYDKLMLAVKPQFEDESPIDPFDLWEGANFKLKIRKVEGQTNYDSSTFEGVSQLLPTDKELEVVWGKQYKLLPFISEDVYKPFDKLEERLSKVLGLSANSVSSEHSNKSAASLDLDDDLPEESNPKPEKEEEVSKHQGKVTEEKSPGTEELKLDEDTDVDNAEVEDEDADTLAFFETLANQDN